MYKKTIAISLIFLCIIEPIKTSYFSPNITIQSISDYLKQNPRYIVGTAALVMGSIPTYLYFKKQLAEKRINVLKSVFNEQLQKLWPTIANDSVTRMYQQRQPFSLYIPHDINLTNVTDLENLFKQYQINPGLRYLATISIRTWKSDDWEIVFKELKSQPNQQANFNIKQLPALLNDAKSILKSFLLTNDLFLIQDQFIKKSGINRLFTYIKLQQIINQKKLSHIHLPLKMLVIQEKKTGKYLSPKAAETIIDDIMKIYATSSMKVLIDFYSDNYNLIIFAHKQARGKELNQAAYEDLKILLTEAPFDVGFDNIFTDPNGDAVIIDTEFKGESAQSSLEKLERYFEPSKTVH